MGRGGERYGSPGQSRRQTAGVPWDEGDDTEGEALRAHRGRTRRAEVAWGGFGPPHGFLIAKGWNPMEKEKEGESTNKQKRTEKFCSLFFLSKKK